jgi:hypothetical protein
VNTGGAKTTKQLILDACDLASTTWWTPEELGTVYSPRGGGKIMLLYLILTFLTSPAWRKKRD